MAGTHFEEMPVTLLSAVAWVPTAASEKADRESLRLLPLAVLTTDSWHRVTALGTVKSATAGNYMASN